MCVCVCVLELNGTDAVRGLWADYTELGLNEIGSDVSYWDSVGRSWGCVREYGIEAMKITANRGHNNNFPP